MSHEHLSYFRPTQRHRKCRAKVAVITSTSRIVRSRLWSTHAAMKTTQASQVVDYTYISSSSSAFSLIGVGTSRFQSARSPVLCFFYLYLFLLHVFSYNITPPHFRSSYLSLSTHFHVRITTSSSVFLSTWPNHFRLASLIFSLMFATPALAHITSFLIFSIPCFVPTTISTFSFVLSSKFCTIPISMPEYFYAVADTHIETFYY